MARFSLSFLWTAVLALGMAVSPACSQRGKKLNASDTSPSDAGDHASQDALLDEGHPLDGRHPDTVDVTLDAGDVRDLSDAQDAGPDTPDSDLDTAELTDLSDAQHPDGLVDAPDTTDDVQEDLIPDVTPQPIPFLLEGFSAACGVMQSVDYRVTFRMAPFGLSVTQESKNQNYTIRPVSSWIKK